MFPVICVWINGRVNNREAGYLRRHRGHYDVIVMVSDEITYPFPRLLLKFGTLLSMWLCSHARLRIDSCQWKGPLVVCLMLAWISCPAKSRVNTLRPRQDGRHFADAIFTCIFFNENHCILIKFSLKYVRKVPIDNKQALVQIMVWRRSGDKPLSEPMMVSLPTHICVTRPQWVNRWFATPRRPY